MKWLIITRRRPEFDRSRLPEHYAFLEALRSEGLLVLAGPFEDGSGGAYLIEATSRAHAEVIVARDPLYVHGSSDFELRGWRVAES